ncbi:hypothetical protein J4711_14030 [Staphylococcus epidermidis]|nr:hypothetical protein [Staphylococcus epidermidis]
MAFEIQKRCRQAAEAEADIRRRVEAKEVVIGFGHPPTHRQRPAQRGHQGRGQEVSDEAGSTKMYDIAARLESVMWEVKNMFPTWTGLAP